MTCRHFRHQIPREEADELRDADPEPCEVCDRLPHRQWRVLEVSIPACKAGVGQAQSPATGWLSRLLDEKAAAVLPARHDSTPATASA
jgi:hypothetical protein